jgi:hypothetical protein
MSRFTTRRAIAGSILAAAALVASAGVAHAAFGFDDVNEGDTHAAGIQWLVDNAITGGCDADSYCPQQPVTRAQMATFMHRLAGVAAAPSVNAETLQGIGPAQLVQKPTAVTGSIAMANVAFKQLTVACPGTEFAISGGFQILESQGGALSDDWYVVSDQPTSSNGDGWSVSVRTIDGAPHNGYLTVFANCTP